MSAPAAALLLPPEFLPQPFPASAPSPHDARTSRTRFRTSNTRWPALHSRNGIWDTALVLSPASECRKTSHTAQEKVQGEFKCALPKLEVDSCLKKEASMLRCISAS